MKGNNLGNLKERKKKKKMIGVLSFSLSQEVVSAIYAN